jgi:hypothetical protein
MHPQPELSKEMLPPPPCFGVEPPPAGRVLAGVLTGAGVTTTGVVLTGAEDGGGACGVSTGNGLGVGACGVSVTAGTLGARRFARTTTATGDPAFSEGAALRLTGIAALACVVANSGSVALPPRLAGLKARPIAKESANSPTQATPTIARTRRSTRISGVRAPANRRSVPMLLIRRDSSLE